MDLDKKINEYLEESNVYVGRRHEIGMRIQLLKDRVARFENDTLGLSEDSIESINSSLGKLAEDVTVLNKEEHIILRNLARLRRMHSARLRKLRKDME